MHDSHDVAAAHWPCSPQFGLLGGYTFGTAADLKCHSATCGWLSPFTRLDLQFSIIGSRTWYRHAGIREAAWGYGLSAECLGPAQPPRSA